MVAHIVIAVLVVVVLVLVVGLHEKNTNAVCLSKRRLEGRVVVVTGGTRGMGLELARDLAARGARLVVACPAPAEGATALQELRASCPDNPHIYFEVLDLASLRSTREFAARILASHPRLDILVNNAGVGAPSGAVTADNLNYVMQVNYYGAFLLTLLLLPLLRKSGTAQEPSRIVTLTSTFHWLGMADVSDTFKWLLLPPYANSKLCLVLFSRELTRRLRGSHVVINNADPGAVGTTIFSGVNRYVGPVVTFLFGALFKSPWQGMQTALHVALEPAAGAHSGQYYKNCRRTRPVSRATDHKAASNLWEESVRLVRLTDNELQHCLYSQ